MKTPRPSLEDKETKFAAYLRYEDVLLDWAIGMEVPAEDRTRPMVVLALEESEDAYEAANYLRTFLQWPMTIEGVRILDKIYGARATLLSELTEKWVVCNSMRLKGAVGQSCSFNVGDAKVTGTIAAIIHREARLIVEVRQSEVKTVNMSVFAEDVIKIVDALKTTKPTAPTTGGTPAAVRETA
jgi:hypothetical protein